MVAGAVYRPVEALIVPAVVGLMVQSSAVLLALITEAVNCWVCPPLNVMVAGATALTDTAGLSVTVAVDVLVLSAWLVAVTTTVCCVATVAGAV